jgi:hypothetical protein
LELEFSKKGEEGVWIFRMGGREREKGELNINGKKEG